MKLGKDVLSSISHKKTISYDESLADRKLEDINKKEEQVVYCE